jgi:hypothetical protein
LPRALVPWLVRPVVACALAAPLAAQSEPRVQPELRADVIVTAATAYHLGLGANGRLTNYVRLGALAGAGMTARASPDDVKPSVRADLVGRFLLDPFRERRWGPYGAAGLSVRVESEQRSGGGDTNDEVLRTRGYLLIAFGVEGPEVGNRLLPALELGFGGGTRVGLVLRRAQSGRR